MKTFLYIITTALVITLSGCKAGNGDGLNEQGRPLEETPVTPPPTSEDPNKISATLSSIQEHVFTPICSVCHGGANPAAGQDLSSIENSIANLINVQSSNPLFKRVLPGSPEKSYLYLKITGNAQAGAKMPLGQPALPDDAIAAIKAWIAQGALIPDNIIAPAQINGVQVNHQATQQTAITLLFNKTMDFSDITHEQISIFQYTADKQLISANLIPRLQVINDHTLRIYLNNNEQNLNGKRFNLQLNQSYLSTFIARSGQMLDGDGNNLEGGVFSYDFSL